MKALVTGATGFVGANIVEALGRAGWRVRILRRPASSLAALKGLEYETALGDVTDPASLPAALQGCEAVFHAAGVVVDLWQQDLDRLYRVNVAGTRHVVEASLAAGVSGFVHTSSLAALGFPPDDQPVDERQPFNASPQDYPYGHSKYLAELEVQKAVRQGLHAVIVNPSIVMGPRDVNLLNSRLILEVRRGLIPLVPPGGVNIVDAQDLAQGHGLALEKGRAGERYLLTGHNIANLQLTREIAALLDVRPPAGVIPRPLIRPLARLLDGANRLWPRPLPLAGDVLRLGSRYFYADNSKASRELGFVSRPLCQTIQSAIHWLRSEGHLD